MVALLIHFHSAEAEILEKGYVYPDSAQIAYAKLEREIFRKYKTDTTSYKRSYRYYAQTPKLLEEIYTIVVDSLSYRETAQPADSTQQKPKDTRPDFTKPQLNPAIPNNPNTVTRNRIEQKKLKEKRLQRLKEKKLEK